jgi:hypothetical protein
MDTKERRTWLSDGSEDTGSAPAKLCRALVRRMIFTHRVELSPSVLAEIFGEVAIEGT